MADDFLFSRVDVAHVVGNRVRLRYETSPGAPHGGNAIERSVLSLPGIVEARANPAARSLVVKIDASARSLSDAVAGLAFARVPERRSGSMPETGSRPSTNGFALSLASMLAIPLMPAGIGTLIIAGISIPVLSRALKDIGRAEMSSHVLEGIAVSISIFRGDLFAAATTTFMLELGEYLEESISRRSDDMLKGLLAPVGSEIWVERDGLETLIPADEVEVGDTVVVGAGSVVPVDGTVLSGECTVNESSMTGESFPVTKARGDGVLSGTHVEEGRVRVYAESVGTKTAAARIADYVERSLSSKSDAQIKASKLADRLVPAVLGLSGASYLVSGNAQRAAAVLQADFSCALKLATPVAFKAGMYGAGKEGMLIKGADALERLAEADTVVFDKTGTLTEGTLEVTDTLTFDPAYTPDELVCLAASIEEHYFHPVAMAVVEAAKSTCGKHFDHAEVQFIVAHGVASEVNGRRIVVGARHFIEDDEGIDIAEHTASIDALYAEGKSLLFIGYGHRLVGLIALKDRVRRNSAETIARLRRLGIRKVLLLTGDHPEKAAELAKSLDIDGFYASLMPEDKARIVETLGRDGAKILFVGDGINDAPALTGSHVGIAMQRGADIARLTADIALLEDDIGRVADAKAIANETLALVGQNYKLAVGINTSILALAALGALTPVTASLLHNGTTIGILLNALRGRKTNR